MNQWHNQAHTPVQEIGQGLWVKRDDLYTQGGVAGGKVRGCLAVISAAQAQGPVVGLCTASSRKSPQAQIVAYLAKLLGIPAHLHMPTGPDTPIMEDIVAQGGILVRHRPGHNSVIIRRALDDAAATGYLYIPFGMECQEAKHATAAQAYNIPAQVKRVVVPVGSGMSLAGILHGLQCHRAFSEPPPVLGVCVGADPVRRLNRFAPTGWPYMATLVKAPEDYHTEVQGRIGDIPLDPIYEAKCLQYLRAGDCLWIVGKRKDLA